MPETLIYAMNKLLSYNNDMKNNITNVDLFPRNHKREIINIVFLGYGCRFL